MMVGVRVWNMLGMKVDEEKEDCVEDLELF